MTILQTIEKGGQERKVVRIIYKDSKGAFTERRIEPYEIKNGKVWGYCLNNNGIRQFNISGIIEAVLTQESFKPRWVIKL